MFSQSLTSKVSSNVSLTSPEDWSTLNLGVISFQYKLNKCNKFHYLVIIFFFFVYFIFVGSKKKGKKKFF